MAVPTTLQDMMPGIRELMRRYDVQHAYIFGSAAKGSLEKAGDIDFVIRFKSGLDYETYGNNYFGLLYALQELLQRDVDLVAEETIQNPYFKESIAQHKLPVL